MQIGWKTDKSIISIIWRKVADVKVGAPFVPAESDEEKGYTVMVHPFCPTPDMR